MQQTSFLAQGFEVDNVTEGEREGTLDERHGCEGEMHGYAGHTESAEREPECTEGEEGSDRGKCQRVMPGGIEVGPAWGAMFGDPNSSDWYIPDKVPTLQSGYGGGEAPATQQAASGHPPCGMLPRQIRRHGHSGIDRSQQTSFLPELDVEDKELYYNNPELVSSDSEFEEQG
jgi:hypothetical protein